MSNELAIMQTLTPAIFNPVKEGEKKGVDSLLERVKEEVANFNGDISTPAGRKEIASFAHKIATSKTAIDGMGKTLVEEVKLKISLVDKDRKKIRDEFDLLKAKVRKPLTDWEDAEKERIAKLEAGITEAIRIGDTVSKEWQETTIDVMQKRLIEVVNMAGGRWQEFSKRAEQAIDGAIDKIEAAIAKRNAYDKEQAELEQHRKEKAEREQRERDERIKAEAAETARLAAEKAAAEDNARLEAEKNMAEDAKNEAERQAKEAAERAKAEHERYKAQRIADQERADREKAEAVKRERDRIEAEAEATRKAEVVQLEGLLPKRGIDNELGQALLNFEHGNPLIQRGDLCLYKKEGRFKLTRHAETFWMTDEERKQIAEMLANPYPIQDGD